MGAEDEAGVKDGFKSTAAGLKGRQKRARMSENERE